MTYDEAKLQLLLHGGGTYDAAGEPLDLDDGFLCSLRPYQGLIEANFHQVMEALLVVGETIHRTAQVDRNLVESLWTTCSLARRWGVEPNGMLRRNKLITDADVKRLELWIDIIEGTAHGLLRGCPPHTELERYAQYITDVGWWDNIDFFIPLMERELQRDDLFDPSVIVAAFGKLGSRVRFVLPRLHQLLTRTYSWYSPAERCTEEVRGIIRQAIQRIEAG